MTEPIPQDTHKLSTLSNSSPTHKLDDAGETGTLRQSATDLKLSQSLSGILDKPTVTGFHLIERLGSGTYGVVWRAIEESTSKNVAIKFFHSRLGEMWQVVWAEVKQLALLDAVAGIVQLKDAEPEAKPPYFVMNYAEGGSLAARLRKGPVPVPEALRLFRQMVEALAYVHAKGIRHCDLKPANILLDALGKPLIADFGQAHLSLESQTTSVNLGSFFYMAPEQADLERPIPDTRWDVYSLGAILYCMITGVPPRANPDLTEKLQRTEHLSTRLAHYRAGIWAAPKPLAHRKTPGMDRALADILEKCLHLDPAKRYQNASEVLNALAERERFRQKRPMLITGMAFSLLVVVGLGLLGWFIVNTSVQEAKSSLVEQLQRSDQTAVQIMANVTEERIAALKKTVADFSEQAKLVPAVEKFFAELKEEQIADQSYFANKSFQDLETLLFESYRPGVRFWSLFHPDGRLLAGSYVSKRPKDAAGKTADEKLRGEYVAKYRKIAGKPYHHRDYYHGQGGDRLGEKLPYLNRTYLSEPYASTLEAHNPVTLSISTPVYASSAKDSPSRTSKPIAILVGSIDVEKDVHSWLNELVRFDSGCAVILDHHGHCVFHSGAKNKEFVTKRVDGKLERRLGYLDFALSASANGPVAAMNDELSGKPLCLPARAVIDNPAAAGKSEDWHAFIFHYEDEVFEKTNALQRKLLLVFALGGAGLTAIVALLWIWLLRSMRRRTATV